MFVQDLVGFGLEVSIGRCTPGNEYCIALTGLYHFKTGWLPECELTGLDNEHTDFRIDMGLYGHDQAG